LSAGSQHLLGEAADNVFFKHAHGDVLRAVKALKLDFDRVAHPPLVHLSTRQSEKTADRSSSLVVQGAKLQERQGAGAKKASVFIASRRLKPAATAWRRNASTGP
jgi:hypothetical protein